MDNKCCLFQGHPVDSSFPGVICKLVFDPKLGEGQVLISDDGGTPALLLCGFMWTTFCFMDLLLFAK